jgi:hypothetical protein
MFVEAADGAYISLAAILEVRSGDKPETAILRLSTGEVRTATWEKWRTAVSGGSQKLVPAEPGTYLLYYGVNEGQPWFLRSPIIAWAVDGFGFVEPVRSDAIATTSEFCPTVLHPDGSVESVLGFWPTYEDWVEGMIADCPISPRGKPSRLRVVV